MEYLGRHARTIDRLRPIRDYQRISKGAWAQTVFWATYAVRGRLGEGPFTPLPDSAYVWWPLWIIGTVALVYSLIQLSRGGWFRSS